MRRMTGVHHAGLALRAGTIILWMIGGAGSVASADDADPEAPPSTPLLHGQYLKGQLPKREGLAVSLTAPGNAHLTYFGGRVVSNAQVVQVLYGAGSYPSQVSSTASPSMATFYQGVLNSPYVDWLTEYNTTTQAGTRSNQTIGRGSFLQLVSITPSAANNTTVISDAHVQAELTAQIVAGNLPAPTHDAAGNNNTIYAIFFPHGKTISLPGSGNSCAQFCAYHSTIGSVPGFGEVYYSIHPDMQAGSGCELGCGTSTLFGNYTSVASHELVESITDPEAGVAQVLAPPLGWYDTNNGEIADICTQDGTVVGSDGVTYNVQTLFSNAVNDCIVSKLLVDDFSISLNPTSKTIPQGGSGTVAVTTAVTSGSAQSISLSASGLPAGVSASFNPSSVTAGSGSTLTLTAAANSTIGTAGIATITGTAASGSHAVPEPITVGAPQAPPAPVITAPALVGAGSTNRPASVVNHAGSSYAWSIANGTITSGQGTSGITFTAGAAGITLTLSVTETALGLTSLPGNAAVTVAPAGSAVVLRALTPCRVLDTRNAAGPLGAPALQAGGTRTFNVAASSCGIPAGAAAISVNLTVTNAGALGELVVFPSDVARPIASSISFKAGSTRANNGIVSLSGSGPGPTFSVFNNSAGTVDFIVDVNGYFQ